MRMNGKSLCYTRLSSSPVNKELDRREGYTTKLCKGKGCHLTTSLTSKPSSTQRVYSCFSDNSPRPDSLKFIVPHLPDIKVK
jgi:hypothetical protein